MLQSPPKTMGKFFFSISILTNLERSFENDAIEVPFNKCVTGSRVGSESIEGSTRPAKVAFNLSISPAFFNAQGRYRTPVFRNPSIEGASIITYLGPSANVGHKPHSYFLGYVFMLIMNSDLEIFSKIRFEAAYD